MTSTGNKKRSVIIMNKRTSVCLEESFWLSLHAIVRMERTTIEAFIEGVKTEYDPRNLSSSLRVVILEYFQRIAIRKHDTKGLMIPTPSSSETGSDRPQTSRERRNEVVAFWSGVHCDEIALAK